MTLKFKKKRSLDRTQQVRDASLIVIATEGSKTEKQYFDMFRNSRVQIITLPTEAGKSSPAHVITRLNDYKDEYQIGAGDTLCVMIDVDRWSEKKLSAISRESLQKGYLLAVSNPCFECWLYLHLDDIAEEKITSSTLEKRLKECLGSYNKSNLDVEKFRGHVSDAVNRAKALDVDTSERWPKKTGTHVYKVIEKIV